MNYNTIDRWKDDSIQFPRLLAEILAVGGLDRQQTADVAAAMDLSVLNIEELFDRADDAWERIKSEL